MMCDDNFGRCTLQILKKDALSETALPRHATSDKSELPKTLLQCIKEDEFCVKYRMGCSKKFMDCSLKALKTPSHETKYQKEGPSTITNPLLFFVSQAAEAADSFDEIDKDLSSKEEEESFQTTLEEVHLKSTQSSVFVCKNS